MRARAFANECVGACVYNVRGVRRCAFCVCLGESLCKSFRETVLYSARVPSPVSERVCICVYMCVCVCICVCIMCV